jgi:hypothetical protein
MDIVAHVERVAKPTEDDPGAAVWIGQIQPRDNLVTKDGTARWGIGVSLTCPGGSRWRRRRLAPDAKLAGWRVNADRRDVEGFIDWSKRRDLAEGYHRVPEPVFSSPIGARS